MWFNQAGPIKFDSLCVCECVYVWMCVCDGRTYGYAFIKEKFHFYNVEIL